MDKEYLIQKWLANELSEEEIKVFKTLDDVPFYEEILESAVQFKASGFSNVADFETFKKRIPSNEKPVRKLDWIKPLLRIASVFVIGFTLYYFFFFNNLTQIQTLAGDKVTIELPDASTVIINALSEVVYNKNEWGEKREVNLKGEAFFKVAKGSKFDVVTLDGTVSVLGTQFNVKQRENFFEVKCFEGVVKVTTKSLSKELRAGDNIRLLKGKSTMYKNSYQNPQWTKNVSSFQRVGFEQVISELERQYGITVEMEEINKAQLFTGGFVHDNLENALRSICEPLDLKYKFEKANTVKIYGNVD